MQINAEKSEKGIEGEGDLSTYDYYLYIIRLIKDNVIGEDNIALYQYYEIKMFSI